MRPDEKAFLGTVLKMSAVAGFIHTFVETPLHEYGHYWAASWLGAPMYIDGERSFWIAGQAVSAMTQGIVSLAGGLVAGILLLALFFLVKAPYRDGLVPLIAAQFAYAPLDGTLLGDALGLAALGVVWAFLFVAYVARFLGWGGMPSVARATGRKILRRSVGRSPWFALPRARRWEASSRCTLGSH